MSVRFVSELRRVRLNRRPLVKARLGEDSDAIVPKKRSSISQHKYALGVASEI